MQTNAKKRDCFLKIQNEKEQNRGSESSELFSPNEKLLHLANITAFPGKGTD